MRPHCEALSKQQSVVGLPSYGFQVVIAPAGSDDALLFRSVADAGSFVVNL